MDVFVYGTLTDPEQVASVLGGTHGTPRPGDTGIDWAFVGDATLHGLHRVDGRYPTLAPGGSTRGRLLRLGDAETGAGSDLAHETAGTEDAGLTNGLAALDAYEGVDRGLYVRVPVPRAISDAYETPPRLAAQATTGVAVYIGDPARLDPEEAIEWPGTGEFEDRVRSYVETADVWVAVDSD